MIPVTQETKTALHQAVKQVRAQITWATSADTTETITSEDKLISMKKEAEGYYCKSTLRKITVVLTGTDTNLLDRRITALVQVKTGANTWGNISWGSFTITEAQVDEAKGTSTFVGYGGIAMLQKQEYVAGELTFPTTVGGLLKQVADKFALTIDPSVVILPEEYQQVEYLRVTTTQWFDLGILPTAVDTMEADVTLDEHNSTNYDFLVGGDYEEIITSGTSNRFAPLVVISDSRKISIGTRQGWYTSEARWEIGTRKKIKTVLKSGEQSITVDGVTHINMDWQGEPSPVTETTVPAFTYQYKANRLRNLGWNGKIYSVRFSKNGAAVRDLVPCRRKSDSVLGFYDRVTGTFYTNAGTGDFVAGNNISSLPNLDAPITEDLWAKITGTTYRDILEEIAGATGSIAVIGHGDDTLNFETPPVSEASETLTEANLITAKIGEKWGKVSAVVLSRQPQGDNIEVVDQATADSPGGKNLFGFDKSGTFSANRVETIMQTSHADNEAEMTAITSVGTQYVSFTTTELESGTRYYLSCKAIKETAGTDGAPSLRIQYRKSENGTTWSTYSIIGEIIDHPTQGATYEIKGEITAGKYTQILFYNNAGNPVTPGEKTKYYEIQIEKGRQQTTYEPYKPNGRVDLVIANNEILDPQRETTAQPLLDSVKGWEYRNAEIKTEGHGYHEIGDRLDLNVAGEIYKTIVTKSAITINGGIQETLTSATPEIIPIDYAKSGGITKTVFRTELTVDKQAQQIDSIVSRQDATDAAVAEQFTQVTQNLTSIVANVQSTGGGNLIRNSVGFGKDNDGILTIWQYGTGASATTVHSQSAPASLSAGAVSGHEIQMIGASTISQDITLTPGETYTLALRAKKNTAGAVTITVGNTTNSENITLAAGTAYDWQRQNVEFTPTMSANTVTITVPSGASVELTDLMLATGGALTWRQASGEIYNAQVSLDQAGVQVRSSVYTGDYVEITPLEFAGYSNASGTMRKVFSLNRETTEVEQLEARSQIKMPPIKIVPINNSSYKGWAFVKEE